MILSVDDKEKRATMEKWIYLNAVLEAVKLPACIADLNTGLANVNRDALSHLLGYGDD